jgi:hypothetical protein
VTDADGRRPDDLDAGAYIGREPELAAETIPGGVKPGDVRIAAHDAAPGVPGEPGAPDVQGKEDDQHREAGQDR